MLSSAVIVSLRTILSNYYVSLLEDLCITSIIIGTISAIGSFIASSSSRFQQKIQNRLKNKTLTTIALLLSISTIVAGILGLNTKQHIVIYIIIILMYFIYYFVEGTYYTMIEKYLSNFSNEKIDTKIFTVNNLFSGCAKVVTGLFASFLLDKFKTAICMIIIGIILT